MRVELDGLSMSVWSVEERSAAFAFLFWGLSLCSLGSSRTEINKFVGEHVLAIYSWFFLVFFWFFC